MENSITPKHEFAAWCTTFIDWISAKDSSNPVNAKIYAEFKETIKYLDATSDIKGLKGKVREFRDWIRHLEPRDRAEIEAILARDFPGIVQSKR